MAKNEELYNEVFDYLVENPDTSDDEFHEWAEEEGFDHEEAEEVAYEMAAKLARMMKGGESKGIPPKGMTPAAEAMGIDVEYEHTSDYEIARKIAWDHLAEYDNYYEALEEMEANLEKEQEEKQTSKPSSEKLTVNSFLKDKRFWVIAASSLAFGAILALANKK